MYNFLLHAHSGLRWLVLLAVVISIGKSLIGWFGGGAYSKFDKIVAVSFVGMMHLQLLIGLVLYFVYSPFVTYNMGDPTSRFWSVEHIALMLLAIAAAQVGRSVSKKSKDAKAKFRFQAIFFTISLALMLLGIPWDRI